MKNILFVANSGKRYDYFKQLAEGLEGQARVIKESLPFFKTLVRLGREISLDETELLRIHMHRQEINYPIITRFPLLGNLYRFLCVLTERVRYHYYIDLFSKDNCDTVVLWNGQKQPYLTVLKAARATHKEILFMENGLLPKTTTADFSGVNADNCLPRNPQFYRNLPDHYSETENSVELTVRVPLKHKDTHNEATRTLPKNYIFIPFQVPSDTQIVVNSPWITSMEMFFAQLDSVQQQLRATLGDDAPYFIFKEHPSWKGSFSHLHDINPHCIFANANNTQSLIEGAQAVVTINSTVGLEAILLGQKVITLGHAAYTIDDIVLQADNFQQLMAHVAAVSEWQPNQVLRRKFIAFLARDYCVPESWEDNVESAEQRHVRAMVARLLKQDTLAEYLQAE